jgi:hypothetical protein
VKVTTFGVVVLSVQPDEVSSRVKVTGSAEPPPVAVGVYVAVCTVAPVGAVEVKVMACEAMLMAKLKFTVVEFVCWAKSLQVPGATKVTVAVAVRFPPEVPAVTVPTVQKFDVKVSIAMVWLVTPDDATTVADPAVISDGFAGSLVKLRGAGVAADAVPTPATRELATRPKAMALNTSFLTGPAKVIFI